MATYSLESLAAQEQSLVVPHFTSADAFTLGVHIREQTLAEYPTKVVAIRITLATGQILFSTVTGSPAIPDSETWLARKAAAVLRFGVSTLHLGKKIRAKGLKGDRVSEAYPVDDREYACHGGGFPIRVKGVEGVIAVVVVSGLVQEEDHRLAVEGIEWFLKQ
ncbi:hypothetical protein DXG03_008443 [Asterophora parasitica]|uniref:DUF967 domain protein n=1 Tax=Asterophora parasitica TaxID=117018 RepID=A0A9P7GEA6_9AGAR|nr:hypothetical protein DXG03_008443 [Asterophora parasitica]